MIQIHANIAYSAIDLVELKRRRTQYSYKFTEVESPIIMTLPPALHWNS